LRGSIARDTRHWLGELQKPGGALGLPSAAAAVTLERFDVDLSVPTSPKTLPSRKRR
jgi:hypothetical protein